VEYAEVSAACEQRVQRTVDNGSDRTPCSRLASAILLGSEVVAPQPSGFRWRRGLYRPRERNEPAAILSSCLGRSGDVRHHTTRANPERARLFVAAGADGKKDREALVDPGLATFSCRNPTDIS
jgi:hypothetical protein